MGGVAITFLTAPWEKRSPYRQADGEQLLAHARPKDQALILLCAHAGLRVSKAIALTWADVNLPNRVLLVRNSKGGIQRPVNLSERLRFRKVWSA